MTNGGGSLEADVVALLSDLVAIPSVNPAFRTTEAPAEWFGEAAMAAHVAACLGDHGLEVQLDPVSPGRPNVIARLRASGARRLLWEGHLDTVQATGMSIEPFRPVLRDGRLYGRGAVDDKGCLVAFMLALRHLARDPAPVDITFVAAIDEEYHYRGVQHYLGRGEQADGGVAGEPTGLRVVSACKGCVRWEIEIRGRGAHSSRPEEGIDAIAIGADLVRHLRDVFAPRLAVRAHPLLGRPSLICSLIHGGEGINTVPARCSLKFDRRTLPAETTREAWSEIEAEVHRFAISLDHDAVVIMHPPFVEGHGMDVPEDAAIIAVARAACRAEGLPDEAMGVSFGSDAAVMTRAGIPTIIFGPGSIDQAHTAEEFVSVAEVARAARMLVDMARRFA